VIITADAAALRRIRTPDCAPASVRRRQAVPRPPAVESYSYPCTGGSTPSDSHQDTSLLPPHDARLAAQQCGLVRACFSRDEAGERRSKSRTTGPLLAPPASIQGPVSPKNQGSFFSKSIAPSGGAIQSSRHGGGCVQEATASKDNFISWRM
jgi:hypothetical protein